MAYDVYVKLAPVLMKSFTLTLALLGGLSKAAPDPFCARKLQHVRLVPLDWRRHGQDILRIDQQNWDEDSRRGEAWFLEQLNRVSVRGYVAEDRQFEALGFAFFQVGSSRPTVGHLLEIGVDPSYVRKRVGSHLIDKYVAERTRERAHQGANHQDWVEYLEARVRLESNEDPEAHDFLQFLLRADFVLVAQEREGTARHLSLVRTLRNPRFTSRLRWRDVSALERAQWHDWLGRIPGNALTPFEQDVVLARMIAGH